MEQFTKGQPVTFFVLGNPVQGIYITAVKASAKYPQGGHKVEVHGRATVIKTAPIAR